MVSGVDLIHYKIEEGLALLEGPEISSSGAGRS